MANIEVYEKQRERFREDWKVRFIFQDLERLNPKFYPEPSKQIERTNTDGKTYFYFEQIKEGFLTKKEALNIYEKCSRIMHADNPFQEEQELSPMYNLFQKWTKSIIKLMNHHSIVLSDGSMVVGLMQSKNDGLPQASYFKELSGKTKEGI